MTGQVPAWARDRRFDEVLSLELRNEDDTGRLAGTLAAFLSEHPLPVFLDGPLGCGKTTLCRHLVACLDGGEDAEVSSPSFTLMNVYPTRPRVVHCDLYRLGEGTRMPDEVWDELEGASAPVLLCEWGLYLSQKDLPHEYLQIFFDFLPDCGKDGRAFALGALGDRARAFLERARVLAGPSPHSGAPA